MTQELEQGTNATLVAVRNGPGARLRAAREASGFTQLEVAQQLRLSEETIARLEEDNYDPNMPLVFVRGYLRSYAGVIGLDPAQIITEFGHLGIKDPVRDVPDLGQSPQRKLSNFDAGTPKHRPGLLWGSLAVFVCGMIAFMLMYRDQIPALSSTEASAASVSTTNTSTEEAELNAAIEAARKANAQTAATVATPDSTAAASAAATTPATNAAATTTPAAKTSATVTSTPAVPVTQSAADTAGSAKKAPISSEDDDEDNATPVKPVSTNNVVVPSTRSGVKAAVKQNSTNKTHETMLF
ncbi:MAG: helix-turn-helix domain-containing protein [Gammaproteobacteria bacterium]